MIHQFRKPFGPIFNEGLFVKNLVYDHLEHSQGECQITSRPGLEPKICPGCDSCLSRVDDNQFCPMIQGPSELGPDDSLFVGLEEVAPPNDDTSRRAAVIRDREKTASKGGSGLPGHVADIP